MGCFFITEGGTPSCARSLSPSSVIKRSLRDLLLFPRPSYPYKDTPKELGGRSASPKTHSLLLLSERTPFLQRHNSPITNSPVGACRHFMAKEGCFLLRPCDRRVRPAVLAEPPLPSWPGSKVLLRPVLARSAATWHPTPELSAIELARMAQASRRKAKPILYRQETRWETRQETLQSPAGALHSLHKEFPCRRL
jgi:transposase